MTSNKNNLPQNEHQWRERLAHHHISLTEFVVGNTPLDTRLSFACDKCQGTETNIAMSNLIRRRHYCQQCRARFSYTTQNIKNLLKANGGNYLSGEVENRESLIQVQCGCGKVSQKRAQDIRRTPNACEHCRNDKIRLTHLVKNDNLTRAHNLATQRGGLCLAQERYFSVTQKITWQCSVGHIWKAPLSSVDSQGSWCPTCSNSLGENLVRELLQGAFGKSFNKQRPAFLQGAELDGYCEELALAFEHQGRQHYQRNAAYHRRECDLVTQIERDALKFLACQKAGVKLIVVPYSATEDGVDGARNFLHQALMALDVEPELDIRQVQLEMRQLYDRRADARYQAFCETVNKRGGSFDPNDYQGMSFSLRMTCAQGFSWTTKPQLVVKGHWCPGPCCSNKAKKDLGTIEASLNEKGWSLRDSQFTYKNAHQRLPMQCSNGHEIDRSWNDWEQGHKNCKKCKKEALARIFLITMWMRGITVDVTAEAYENEQQVAKGVCGGCGQTSEMRIAQWKSLGRCPNCAMALPSYAPSKVQAVDFETKEPGTPEPESCDEMK